MRKLSIKIIDILSILTFFICFIKAQTFQYYNLMIIFFSLIAFPFLFFRVVSINKEEFKKMNNINVGLVIFISIIIIITLITQANIIKTMVFSAKVLMIFMLIEYATITNNKKRVEKIFFKLLLIFLIINDLKIITIGGEIQEYTAMYMLGSKFMVSYLHILLLALYYKSYKNKIIGLVLTIISLYICMKVMCTTGLIGVVIFTLLNFFQNRINLSFLKKPKTIITVLIIFCAISYVFSYIVQIDFIKYFIVNVLHESLTLTGRLKIYELNLDLIKNSPLIGYGFENIEQLLYSKLLVYNSQNALTECILYYGIPNTIILLLNIKNIFKMNYLNGADKNNPYISIIYTLAILGCVEISINIIFFICLALMIESKKGSDLNEINVKK